MITTWIIVCSAFIAGLALICYRIYTLQITDHELQIKVQEQINRIEDQFNEVVKTQLNIRKRLDQLSMDVMHREIYKNSGDRHQLAIKDAKAGRSLNDLMQRNGLSSDEAALIIALHGNTERQSPNKVINANLTSLQSEELE